MSLIHVDNLIKEFSRPDVPDGRFQALRRLVTTRRTITRAVDGVSFDIEPGELVGYLGPNGAGKSTTIKMLTGILVPTAGVCEVAGRTPWRSRIANAASIGVVFGQRSQLWWDLPPQDSFEIIRDLYDIAPSDYADRLGRFTELLDLGGFLATPVRSLSLGQRMRGDLVAAMLYEPPILYLDEPTVGLDVVAKARITEFIAETNAERRTTVLLTTHDLDDVERLCRRIIVIDSGRVLYDGGPEQLKRRYVPYRELIVSLTEPDPTPLPELPGVELVEQDDHRRVLRFTDTMIGAPELIQRVSRVWPVRDLSVVEPRLGDVITELYGEGRR
jgi:ABC-2 type transport system ATP-binding protein